MANYRIDQCFWCKAETWCERRIDGRPQCRGCQAEAFFALYLYPPLGLRLIGWQRQVLRDIYGTVNPIDGVRKFRRAYVSTPKKNGKSYLTGGMPLYHLLSDSDRNPQAYGCASAKEQAGLVFEAAKQLVEANPDLRSKLKVIDSKKRIVRRDGAGFYQVLSADGDVQDGISPSLLIRDEIHRWKSAKAETLYDVTTKGQINREEPLDIAITTAGAEYESPLWFGEYEHAKKVLDGAIPAHTLYAAIWEADSAKVKEDPEYWKSKEARIAANPSHEHWGGFLKDSAIVVELEKALAQPDKRATYLRYHLNLPLTATTEPVIDTAQWQACGDPDAKDPVDLRKWPEMDIDYLIRKWGLIERTCVVGVDASWTTDMTAVVFGFPPEYDGGVWTLLPFFFVPVERVPQIERICRIPLQSWINQGFVTATAGNAIDLRSVKDRIRWGAQMFDVRELAYDRQNFRTEAMELNDEGIPAFEVPQNFLQLSYPTKFLLGAYVDQRIRHGNHPVLNWHAACMQLQYDRKDNVQPIKPERLKSSKRIDGIQATVTMLNRGIEHNENAPVSYTGLRSVG